MSHKIDDLSRTISRRFFGKFKALPPLRKTLSCVVVVGVIIVGAAALASAAEFQTCQMKAGGPFENTTCTKEGAKKEFAWVGLQAGQTLKIKGGRVAGQQIFVVETNNTSLHCLVEFNGTLETANKSEAKFELKKCVVQEFENGNLKRECNSEKEPIAFEVTGTLNAARNYVMVPKGGGNLYFEVKKAAGGSCTKSPYKFEKKAAGQLICGINPGRGLASTLHGFNCGCNSSKELEFNGEPATVTAFWVTTAVERWKLG
jgi:hypothetical protein